MNVYIATNARSYGVRMSQRAAAIDGDVLDAMKSLGSDAIKAAYAMSSGPLKQATLTAMGHPYSRRHPTPVGTMYPAMVNLQSGRFLRAWNTRVTANRASVSLKLYNNSPEARFLTAKGTRRMVGRPILEAIAKELTPVSHKKTRAALQKAISYPASSVGRFAHPGSVGSMLNAGLTATQGAMQFVGGADAMSGGGGSFSSGSGGMGGINTSAIRSAFRRGYALGMGLGG